MDSKDVGKYIKAIREEKKISQRKLAEMIGRGESTIGNYETGATDMEFLCEQTAETSEPAFYRLIMITNRVLHTQYPEIFISGGKPEWKKRK